MPIQERIATAHDSMGQWLLSLMTPTQIAELFPRYYMKNYPDIGGFLKAMPTSMSVARQMEVEKQLNNTATGSGAGQNMKSGGWRGTWQEGMDRATASKKGVTPEPQLSPEQRKSWDDLKKGPIDAGDPRMKMFGTLTEEQLKKVGVSKYKEGGKELYRYNAPKPTDEEVTNYIKNNGNDNGGQRSGGSRSWRNRNPGNIEYGNFARSMGAVGTDGRFAIFRTEEDGVKAQRELLFNGKGYRNLTLAQAIGRWAPASENNVPAYIAAMGADPNQKMSEFSREQQDILLKNMRKHEGWKPGKGGDPITADYSEKSMELAREKVASEVEAGRIKDLSKLTTSEPMEGTPSPLILPEAGDVSKTGFNRFSKTRVDPKQEVKNVTRVVTPFGEINVHSSSAMAYKGYFEELAAAGAPIQKLGSLNIRKKRWGESWSEHAYGNAVDIDDMLGWSPKMKRWLEENPGKLDEIGLKWGMKRQDSLGGNYDPNHVEFGGVVSKEAREQLDEQIKKGQLTVNSGPSPDASPPNASAPGVTNDNTIRSLEGSTGPTAITPPAPVQVDRPGPEAVAAPNSSKKSGEAAPQSPIDAISEAITPTAKASTNSAPPTPAPSVNTVTASSNFKFNKEAYLEEVGRKTMAYAPIVGPGREYVWNETRKGLAEAEKSGALKYNEKTGELQIKDMNHPKIQEILGEMKKNNLDRNIFLNKIEEKKAKVEAEKNDRAVPPAPVESALPPQNPTNTETKPEVKSITRNGEVASKTETPNTDKAKVEPPKNDTKPEKEKVKVKVEAPAPSAPKLDSPKADASKAEPPKVEAKPNPEPPKKPPVEVKTNATGGINKVDSNQISGYPMDRTGKDNMVVVNKHQKPLFTMNTNEKMVMDPKSKTAAVTPATRNSPLRPPISSGNQMPDRVEHPSERQDMFGSAGKGHDQTKVDSNPSKENASSGVNMSELSGRSKDWYLSPSIQRASFRAAGSETGEPNSNHHYSHGNRS